MKKGADNLIEVLRLIDCNEFDLFSIFVDEMESFYTSINHSKLIKSKASYIFIKKSRVVQTIMKKEYDGIVLLYTYFSCKRSSS